MPFLREKSRQKLLKMGMKLDKCCYFQKNFAYNHQYYWEWKYSEENEVFEQ